MQDDFRNKRKSVNHNLVDTDNAFIHQITIMLTITVISMIYFLFTNTKIQDIKEEIEENITDTQTEAANANNSKS